MKLNLKLNPKKYEFTNTNLTFLIHVVNRNDTQHDLRRIKIVIKFPIPTSITNHYEKIMSITTCLFSCNLVLLDVS